MRDHKKIRGINIRGNEDKISRYADDTQRVYDGNENTKIRCINIREKENEISEYADDTQLVYDGNEINL